MSVDRALVFPGLIPLSDAAITAVVRTRDEHLDLAAHVCEFDPSDVIVRDGLTSTVHEALLAVAVIRRVASEPTQWAAFGGLSAGCLPSLWAAGVISEQGCFELVRLINNRQIETVNRGDTGHTLVVLASSDGDARQLVEVLRMRELEVWLSIDLGGGLIGLGLGPGVDLDVVTAMLNRLGVLVMDSVNRAEHCPCAVPDRAALTEIVASVDFSTGHSAVVSPVTGKLVDSPAASRQMLVEQWYNTASLPALLEGLGACTGVRGIDLVSPSASVYITRTAALLTDRTDHRVLAVPG